MFSGGGSGGHLTPSIAVAENIRSIVPNARISFFVSARPVDRSVLQRSSLWPDPRVTVIRLPLVRLPKRTLTVPKDAWRCWQAWRISRCFLKRNPTHVMLGTGGFASLPGLLAAKLLNVATVLFEANSICGSANRWMASRAAARYSGWPVSDSDFDWEPLGIPIRSMFDTGRGEEHSQEKLRKAAQQVLIVGGSQGAQRLNQIVSAAFRELDLPEGWTVLHQTGPQETLPTNGNSHSSRFKVTPFLDDMAGALRRASVVISRAGAVTLAEIAATQCPSILIPLHSAANNHQTKNARLFADHSAATVVCENDPTAPKQLADALRRLLANPARQQQMALKAHSLHTAGAAERLAGRLLELARRPLQMQNAA